MIKLNNVSIQFGKKVILSGYTKEFSDNKIYCIMGRSGCGKSTLLRIIAGLLKPDSGEVYHNDEKIVNTDNDIFMMHQTYSNFPWMTCLQNVLLPLDIKGKVTEESKKEAIELLKKVGLEDSINKYPYQLSGGMRQRLALARTIMAKPPVILMDEPLSALDPKTRNEMQDLVLDLHYKTKNTIILVTHDLDEANKMKDELINF